MVWRQCKKQYHKLIIVFRIVLDQASIRYNRSPCVSLCQSKGKVLLSFPILSFLEANNNFALSLISFGKDAANLLSNVTINDKDTYVLIIKGNLDSYPKFINRQKKVAKDDIIYIEQIIMFVIRFLKFF